jgi:nucleotide-binding universal stress UspA family protein
VSPRAYHRILVPIDFSESSRHALAYALDFAKKVGPARLLLVHAYYVPPEIEAFAPDRVPGYLGQLSEQAAKDLEALLTELQDANVTAEYQAEPGSPDHVITKLAREHDIDLIVLSTHGRSGFSRLALGSVAERVVQMAPCPVITVKDPKHD